MIDSGTDIRPAGGHVVVVGAGRMGSGIAHALLISGARVALRDVSEAAAALGRDRVERALRSSADRGTLDGGVDDVMARLSVAVGLDRLGEPELVVEAVPEELDLKVRTWQSVSRAVPRAAILATNTSSLSIESISSGIAEPSRFVGMHFFNPVPASQLVEVVQGPDTAEATVGRAAAWVRALGKEPIVVSDSPGFASSRLGVLVGLEAIRMLEEGVASAEDIDRAMTLGYRFPIGPLRLTDLVGLDVRLGIAEYLHGRIGSRFEPPQLLRDLVARGELGRKTGRGFFAW